MKIIFYCGGVASEPWKIMANFDGKLWQTLMGNYGKL
jgi:hypothetical protein